nr:hypothetical protein [Tanacetum cinerariifolium]
MDKENPWGKDRPGKDVEIHLYRSMIGSLMYLTASRPDIMFAVCACARYQVTPKECHFHAVKRIFRYLKVIPSWDYGTLKNIILTWWHIKIVIMVVLHKIESQLLKVVSFWAEETTDQETNIIATVDGKSRTISESSLRRHLKLNDEEGISSLPDAEIFENLSLMGYNILPNQSNFATAVVCLATNRVYNFSKMIFDGMVRNINNEHASLSRDNRQGEAFPTIFSLDAGQDREKIAKTFAFPYESLSRVPSLDAEEGNMQQRIHELMELYEPAMAIISDGSQNQRSRPGNICSMEAANILSSGGAAASVSLADVLLAAGVPTVSGSFPTVSGIFTTASVKVIETEVPKKRKFQEQIDAQVAREMEEEFARENQRSNEVIAKHLNEYEQAEADLSIGEKIELISELVKYQDHRAKILKYQAQQRKPLSNKEQREFYMSVLRSHAGWKTKHFRGMTLEQIKEKFVPVWKQFKDFVPMSSKEESERVKHPIIDWDIHSEGKREYWKIIILGVHTAVYQFFVDMLKQFDREDLHQLWTLVKETFSIKQATRDKEKELWVELKRLFEPDFEDQL